MKSQRCTRPQFEEWRKLRPARGSSLTNYCATRDRPRKKQDLREPTNHPIPEPHWGAHKLIPRRPENSLEAPDTAGVCTTLTAEATLGSRAALKLTSPKPEKSEEELETVEDWTPFLQEPD
ncbi:hypothetical protein E2C01_081689 [Portunus trituberculatus]|uniref:Uncharacterized protein n=1 Tax=Portunus trituberculatus TaxID=210409 RepID=A0A5B7ISI9_PORTR|nr:hypothetical protein [Portunus trituberculatus]